MQFFRRFLEGLFINFAWWVLQAIIVAIPLIVVATEPDIFSSRLLFLFIIIIAAVMSCALWHFSWRNYPPLSWDIIHRHNTYTLTYECRENAIYDKKIVAVPMRKHIEAFKGGEYRWSGSSSEPSIAESADFEISYNEIHGRTEYTVCPKVIVRKYKLLRYTLNIKLYDDNKTAAPSNFIYIKRPTKKITLVLKMPIGVPICNVRYEARTKYGEDKKLIYKEGFQKQENGYNIYTFTVRRPKMFCEYEIRWEWCG